MIDKYIEAWFNKTLNYINLDKGGKREDKMSREEWIKSVKKDLEKILKETEKAYGGCQKCYGKGYSTEMVGPTIASADFEGEVDRVVAKGGVKINFCSCGRGKQLKALIKEEE